MHISWDFFSSSYGNSGRWSIAIKQIYHYTGKLYFLLQTLFKGDHTRLIKNLICTKASTSSWMLLGLVIWHSSILSTDLPATCRLATHWLQSKASRWDGNVLEQELHEHLRKWLLSSWCSITVISVVQNYLLPPLCHLSKARNTLPMVFFC